MELRPIYDQIATPAIAVEQHSPAKSTLLHLVPGAVVLVTYLSIFAPLSVLLALPRQLGYALNVLLVLVPIQLGCLLYFGYRKNRQASLDGIVLYRRSLPRRELIPLVLALFSWAVIVITLLGRIDYLLLDRIFYWLPASLLPKAEIAGHAMGIIIGA